MEIKQVEENYGKNVRYIGECGVFYKLCGMYSNSPSETLCRLYHEETEARFLARIHEIELV